MNMFHSEIQEIKSLLKVGAIEARENHKNPK